MNILYIAPYRDIEYKHICENHMLSLEDKYDLHILPIYLSNNQISVDQYALHLEQKAKTSSGKYDTVIQYAPPEYLFAFDRSIAKKSVCIPIINYPIVLLNKNINNFDKILCDSKQDIELIKKGLQHKSKKIKLLGYKKPNKANAKKIQLNHLNNTYKFYIFINDNNINYVNSILLGFASAFTKMNDCCLLIICSNQQISQKVSKYIDIISQKIMYIKNYIKLIQETTSNKSDYFYANIHSSCDCLIDIKSISNYGFHSFLAKEFDNSVISNDNLKIDHEFCYMDGDQVYFDIQTIIQNKNISETIKSIAKTKPIYQENNIPTLDQAIQ